MEAFTIPEWLPGLEKLYCLLLSWKHAQGWLLMPVSPWKVELVSLDKTTGQLMRLQLRVSRPQPRQKEVGAACSEGHPAPLSIDP